MENKKEESKISFRQVLSYYWPHVKKYKWFVALSFLSVTVGSLASGVVSPVIYQKIIDLMTNSNNPVISKELVSFFIVFVLVSLLNFIANRTTGLVGNFYESKIIESLQKDAFSKLIVHSRGFFC